MPREPEATWENGIRSVRRDEMGRLRAVLNAVFFEGLADIQPHAFNDDNASNLRVVVENGEVVSHIGTIRRAVSILGCTLRVASLGGVATLESHRGKGHATALLRDTMRDCRKDGVDYIMVSGYRNMYHRHGCRYVGRDWMFHVPSDRAGDFDDPTWTVVPASAADVDAIGHIYRREPVRWMRPPSDIAFGIDGWVQNRPAKTHLIRRGDRPVAFGVVQQARDRDDGRVNLLDYAGERSAIVGALGKWIRTQELKRLSLHVKGFDSVLYDMLYARGLPPERAALPGTTMVIHFEQLLEKMRPYFVERIGEHAATGLAFREVGDEYHIYYGGDRVVAESRGAAAHLIFGTWDGAEDAMLTAGGRAGEVLRKCLPIPGVWYGVNYV